MAKTKLGSTLTGAKWLHSLNENFGDDGRFARGKTYFNKGNIKSFATENNIVYARVKGSYSSSYFLEFTFYQDEMTKQKIKQYFIQNPLEQTSLLNGALSEQFFEWCKSEGIELTAGKFYSNEYKRFVPNYKMGCNCYDYYDPRTPCKHLLALMFALCVEIDHNPSLLLKLHGIELEELFNTNEVSNEVPYPIEITYKENFTPSKESVNEPIKILHQQDSLHFITSLMPANPPFAPFDYRAVMVEFYKFSSLNLPQIITPIYNENIEKIERLFREAKIEIVVDTTMGKNRAIIKHKIFRQEDVIHDILTPYIIDSNTLGCSIHLLEFVKLFLSFKSEEGGFYYRYFYQLCRVGYLLLNSSSFIPSVIKEKAKSRFFIGWIPLETEDFKNQLELLSPFAISSVRHSQKGEFFDATSGAKMFLSGITTEYVKALQFMHKRSKDNPPDISKSFFQGSSYTQKGAGRHNIDKAVANTFSIFMLQKSSYELSIGLYFKEEEKQYEISLFAQNEDTKHTLKVALLEDSSKELLKLIAPITSILPQIENLFKEESIILEKEAFEDFILERASLLSALGLKILLPKELHNLIKPRLSLFAKAKKVPKSFLDLQKILEYDWVIALGEHTISIDEFMELVKEQGQIIHYKNSFITLSPDELKNLLASTKKKIKITPFDVLREKFSGNLVSDGNLDEFFTNLFIPKNVKIPKTLNATLRGYQIRGIEWGISNLLNNFGVILADDMGLGKTIQTIAILLYLKENNHLKNKTLVVVPTSLLNNWQNELSKFAPTLSYTLFYGNLRKVEESDIVITTYDTLKRDEFLKEQKWDTVVIDEAQKIKNPDTQSAKTVKAIDAKYKIALSGTPVENSLSELWSIFDFTLCGYLGDLNSFISKFAKPIEIEKDEFVATMLKNITAPFMLRRLKTDKTIIDDLPDKIVIDEYASMVPKQAAMYESIVQETLKKLDTLLPNERFGLVFKLITELKQVCNHPRNLDKISPSEVDLSGKSQMLLELLETIVAKKEKVLIFTQYVEMAKILSEMIEKELLIEPLILDGSMSKNARQKVVDSFEKTNEYPIFILSLKAGGVGLNLTSASNVIHYDLWFNPAVENQATDRAFRIGQTKNVFVYRFITKNSFEEKIDNMIKAKLAIGEMSVAVGDKSIASMDNEEIKSLFLN